jgi:biotin carboxyl carrier protein
MSLPPLEFLQRADGEHTLLLSPGVGYFTNAPRVGSLLSAGQIAGHLVTLGRARALRVPEGVEGSVLGPIPELVESPAGYGQPLLRLAAFQAGAGHRSAQGAAQGTASGLFVRAAHAGRFWLRPSPGEAPLVAVGDVLEPGRAVGLIEVMKTFAQVHYRPSAGLPERARVKRLLVSDGAEIEDRAALIEVEPA